MDFASMTIGKIKKNLEELEEKELKEALEILALDERTGVKNLVEQIHKKMNKKNMEIKRLKDMYLYEEELFKQGVEWIAGIDEAGRGPLAGPVVAAAVILPKDCFIEGIDDSKKLSDKKRRELYDIIKERAIAISVGIIESKRIDEVNILNATYEAMSYAVDELVKKPDFILLDAVTVPFITYPQKSIIKGDSKSISIAAASIIAKVTRDDIMLKYSKEYPKYGFEKHKGYGTAEHITTLKELGSTPIHRRSFIKNF